MLIKTITLKRNKQRLPGNVVISELKAKLKDLAQIAGKQAIKDKPQQIIHIGAEQEAGRLTTKGQPKKYSIDGILKLEDYGLTDSNTNILYHLLNNETTRGITTSINKRPASTSRPKRIPPQVVAGSKLEPIVVSIPILYLILWPILQNSGEKAVL